MILAKVWITPISGVGGEWPVPVRFSRRHYTKTYVRNYARAIRNLGEGARIEWC